MRKYILISVSLSIFTVLGILYFFNYLNFSSEITTKQSTDTKPKPGIYANEQEANQNRVALNPDQKDLKQSKYLFLKTINFYIPEIYKYSEEDKIAKISLDEGSQVKFFKFVLKKGQTIEELDLNTESAEISPVGLAKVSKENLLNNISYAGIDGTYRNIEIGGTTFEFQGTREVGQIKVNRFQDNENNYIWIGVKNEQLIYIEGSFKEATKAAYFEEYILGNIEFLN